MTSSLAINTLVWLKQPGYPWWPGFVVDPTTVGMELSEGYDTCVLCLPFDSSSVALASSSNVEEIRRFLPEEDSRLLEDGRVDSVCAAAIDEALDMYEKQLHSAEKKQQQSMRKRHHDDGDGVPEHGDLDALFFDDSERDTDGSSQRERKYSPTRKREKRRKRRNEEDIGHTSKRTKKRDKLKLTRRERREKISGTDSEDTSSTQEGEIESSDSDVGARVGVKQTRGKKASRNGVEFSDENDIGASYMENDIGLFKHELRRNRYDASNAVLSRSHDELLGMHSRFTKVGASSFSLEDEEKILEILTTLAKVNVTLEQLIQTKVGVAVGQFISDDFPPRIAKLSHAILNYWFGQLPKDVRGKLLAKSKTIEPPAISTAG
uniref:WGS project CAEQ00000000 data, annotated contig 1829 n=1 Tax=Trypanosoma congolense (strain IL3000) TaxID=1068625 RepID=F9W972_TRYCI|nr:unnamed protein product [Trypanosoma congolense IL3000]